MKVEFLGKPKCIREWVRYGGEFPGDGCLHVKSNEYSCALPENFNPNSFSQNNYDQFDQWLSENSYRRFLAKEQMEDVVENLKQQKPKFSENWLLQVLVYYWSKDAFIQTCQTSLHACGIRLGSFLRRSPLNGR